MPVSDTRSRKDLMANVIQALLGEPVRRLCACTTLSEKDLLYNMVIATQAGGGGGAVSSVFSRTGAVVAENGDYSIGQITGAGTMASQNANAVAITGGTINGTVIGGTTPAAVTATVVQATGSITAGTDIVAGAFNRFYGDGGGNPIALVNNQGPISLNPSSGFGVSIGSSLDVLLFRDAANTLAQRNGTNAQNYFVENTYTDDSNYERGIFGWSANVLRIGASAAGSGTLRSINLIGAGLQINGTPGIDFSGAVTNITVVDGIITAAS